jgi:hypothetical protein
MEGTTLRGSCLCGAVRYEVSPPFLFFHNCHCSRCRKTSGAAHASNLFVKRAQLSWTSGEEQVRRWELPEAEYFCTGFCTTCGSSMPWVSRNGRYVLVPAGTLDDDPGCSPDRNIHWASRAPWYNDVSELPCFDETP